MTKTNLDNIVNDIRLSKRLVHNAIGLLLIGDRDCLSCLNSVYDLLTRIEQTIIENKKEDKE